MTSRLSGSQLFLLVSFSTVPSTLSFAAGAGHGAEAASRAICNDPDSDSKNKYQ